MLMSTHDGAVDHRIFIVGVGREMLKNSLPDALYGPTTEPPMDVFPVAVPFGQVAPRHTWAIPKKHPVDKQAVVRRRHAAMAFLSWKQPANPLPLIVAQGVSSRQRHQCQLQNR
jgi:hypothetical protein